MRTAAGNAHAGRWFPTPSPAEARAVMDAPPPEPLAPERAELVRTKAGSWRGCCSSREPTAAAPSAAPWSSCCRDGG